MVFSLFAKVGGIVVPAHKGLEDGEEDAAVLGHLTLFSDLVRFDPHQGIFRKGGKGVVGLIGQDVAISQKQDTGPPGRVAFLFPISQVPAALKQLPGKLKGDKGLAGTPA